MKNIYIFSALTLICLTSCGQSSTDDMRATSTVTGVTTTHVSTPVLHVVPNPERESTGTHVEVSATPPVAQSASGEAHDGQKLHTNFLR